MLWGGIQTIPSCCVMVSGCWNHDGSHNGSNVEIWPSEHFMKSSINCKVNIASLMNSLFHWQSSHIVDRFRLIPVVVCLHQEPGSVTQFIISMNSISVPFNNHSLIRLNSRNNIVDRGSNSFSSQPLGGTGIVNFFFQHFSQQPACWNSVVFNDTNEIIFKTFCSSGINVDREGTKFFSSQSENTSCNGINSKKSFTVFVVFHINKQFREQFPHFKVQIAAMHDDSIRISDQKASASSEGGEFIHEIEKEYLLEGISTDFSKGVNLSHEVLMFELIFGVPFYSIIEGFRNWQKIDELHESSERFSKISSNWSPSDFRRIIKGDFIDERNVRFNRANMRNHCG